MEERREGRGRAPELYGLPREIDAPMVAPKEIAALAETIRREWHPEICDARIVYMLNERVPKDAPVDLGKARLVPRIMRPLARAEFVIELNWWQWWSLPDDARLALLDHELCHCTADVTASGMTVWRMRRHEIEDFIEIVARRGLWTPQLAGMERALRQLNLFADAPAEAVAAAVEA